MKKICKIAAGVFFTANVLCSCQGDLLYKDSRYIIRKKNIVSYYQASPDLFVKTNRGEVKINLNGFGKRLIAQEKITGITIKNVTDDSVLIHFTASDSSLRVKEEFIGVNIKYAVDSILASGK